ncbi:purine-nucleoside phosphorylase [Nocardia camponoti]|nr:purine-nucleoside phosphorylase [Nocardia camponoti]
MYPQIVDADAITAANAIRARFGDHRIGVVLGSGWGTAKEYLGADESRFIDLLDLPGFRAAGVAGHKSHAYSIGRDSGSILLFMGRTHFYETRDAFSATHHIRVAISLGCEHLILTNASGGINPSLDLGRPAIIDDHINFTASSPLTGSEHGSDKPMYSPKLAEIARSISPDLKSGVYAQFIGPQYETPAEIRMAKILGADMVGMSTALEAIAASHYGAELLALSLVTNSAPGLSSETVNHDAVLHSADAHAESNGRLLARIVHAL